jgi:hypothetical protein
VEDHNECKDLTVLENVVKNVKTSYKFDETATDFDIQK